MPRHLMASLCALMLTGCLGSTKREAPSFQPPPPPAPAAVKEPCRPTPRVKNPDGSMSKAQAERNLGQGDVDLASCEAKRKLAVESWPQPVENPPQPR